MIARPDASTQRWRVLRSDFLTGALHVVPVGHQREFRTRSDLLCALQRIGLSLSSRNVVVEAAEALMRDMGVLS